MLIFVWYLVTSLHSLSATKLEVGRKRSMAPWCRPIYTPLNAIATGRPPQASTKLYGPGESYTRIFKPTISSGSSDGTFGGPNFLSHEIPKEHCYKTVGLTFFVNHIPVPLVGSRVQFVLIFEQERDILQTTSIHRSKRRDVGGTPAVRHPDRRS